MANDGHEFSFSFSLDSCMFVQYTVQIYSKGTTMIPMTSMTIDLLFTVAASISLFALLFASAFVLPWHEDEFAEVDRDWAALWPRVRGYSVAVIPRVEESRCGQPIRRQL